MLSKADENSEERENFLTEYWFLTKSIFHFCCNLRNNHRSLRFSKNTYIYCINICITIEKLLSR